jgi:hypothetical protein
MGKTFLFGILVAAIGLISFFGVVSSAQASTKPKPTKTVTKTKTKVPTKTVTKTKVVPTMTPTPKPQPTVISEPDFHWEMENNPGLLTETGDYTMAWWPWFKNRPMSGSAFLLVNHSEDKSDRMGKSAGSAFNPNGQTPEILFWNVGNRKVMFEIYRNAYLISPMWRRIIVVAQVTGPKVGWGQAAGVNLFLSESEYQSWLARNR